MARFAYSLEVDPEAKRFALGLPENIQRQIAEKIQFLLSDPFHRKTTQKLSGVQWKRGKLPVRRIRSGEYRILYVADGRARKVAIIEIGERKDVYGGH